MQQTENQQTLHSAPHGIEKLSDSACRFAGSTTALLIALITIVGWLMAGPFMQFSERWQLIINSITTIVTFLMVFMIQRSQNKDVEALQMKLDELLKNQDGANKNLIRIDQWASEKELQEAREPHDSY